MSAQACARPIFCRMVYFNTQSTLVVSKSKGLSEVLRDIRTSIFQICRIEENTNRRTKFNKKMYNLTSLVRNIY